MASLQPRYKTKDGKTVHDRYGRPVVASWRVYYRVDGHQRTQSFPGTKAGEAEATEFLEAIEAGTDVADARRLKLSDVEKRWYDEHVSLRCAESTWERDYRPHVDNRIRPGLGHLTVAKLTSSDVDKFVAHMLAGTGPIDKPASPNTVNGTMKVLAAILNWGANSRRKLVPAAVAQHVNEWEKLDHTKEEIVTPTKEQVWVLAEAMPTEQDRLVVRTGALTGMRRGEVFCLQPRDLDTSAGLVEVRRSWEYDRVDKDWEDLFKLPKGRRARQTILLPELESELLAHVDELDAEPDDLLFPNTEGGLEHPSNWYARIWDVTRQGIADRVEEWGDAAASVVDDRKEASAIRRRAAKEARFYRRVKFHWLRHHFVSMMAALRIVTFDECMDMVGHVDEDTAKIYRKKFERDTRVLASAVQEALDAW